MGGYVIDTLYDHVNDIQKHVFEKRYALNFTRDVNDIPMTNDMSRSDISLVGMSLGMSCIIGDAPD
jgi:regulator of PEP synthase PpsR (kinase-PPPase family)